MRDLGLRDGLRSGDVFVPGSRRYADPSTYLYTPAQWAPRQDEYCRLVGKPARAADALEQGKEELHAALAELERALASALPDDTGAVRLDGDDNLVVPPLTAEDVPAEARELKDELAGMLPFAPIASLLIELDARTGFLDCFTHAGGPKLAKSAEPKRNILAVLIAMATNLGLARMAEACGVSYDVLAWTPEWYVREDTLHEANTAIVNHHYTLELARAFGSGTMSSSDGQRFPVRGKSLTARNMVIHRRAGPVDLHPRVRPALHLRHQGHRADRPGGPLRAGRLPRQRHRPARLPSTRPIPMALLLHGHLLSRLPHWHQDATSRPGIGRAGSGGVCAGTAAAR